MNYCAEHKTIRLIYNTVNDRIELLACCWRRNEILHSFTRDEIINCDNLYELIKPYHKILPENHDFKVYSYCNTNEQCCDWRDEEVKTINVSLTTTCNLKCIMCSNSERKATEIDFDELQFTVLDKLIGKNNNLNVLYLTCEGEPFFYKKRIFEFLRKVTLADTKEIGIISNLTTLTPDDIYELERISKQSGVKIVMFASIDGITEDTYSKIRNNTKFEKVLNNAILLHNVGILAKVFYVAMPLNLHELPFIDEFWKQYNIDVHAWPVNGDAYEQHTGFKDPTGFVCKSKEWQDYIKSHS